MNKARCAELSAIRSALEDLNDRLDTAKGEEEDYLDAMPEGLKGGDKGQNAENAISELDSAISYLEYAISSIENAEEQS